MKHRIYYNLHRKCWSVQEKIPGRGWIVIDHASEIMLEDVSFQVSEAGRQRVIRTKRKNVHAFGMGKRIDPICKAYLSDPCWERISYTPYIAGHFFYLKDGLPVREARFAHFRSDRSLYVIPS
jgi:hypothetical protein